jgi:hypothetical protein
MASVGSEIWRQLPTNERPVAPKQPGSLAAAMYPSLTPQAKAWDEWRERDRQIVLKGLREANARADARLRERR